jgi:hypothetical protein
LIGFEIEFVLLNEASELANPLDRIAGYSMTAGLRGSNLSMLEEILNALEASKTGVHYFHTEIADQLEIVLGPMTPVHAIDALMQAQEAIRTICVRHSLKASLTPRPVLNDLATSAVWVWCLRDWSTRLAGEGRREVRRALRRVGRLWGTLLAGAVELLGPLAAAIW